MNDSANTESADVTFQEGNDVPKEMSVKTSMQKYWDHELGNMETNKATTGDLNKYFMRSISTAFSSATSLIALSGLACFLEIYKGTMKPTVQNLVVHITWPLETHK